MSGENSKSINPKVEARFLSKCSFFVNTPNQDARYISKIFFFPTIHPQKNIGIGE